MAWNTTPVSPYSPQRGAPVFSTPPPTPPYPRPADSYRLFEKIAAPDTEMLPPGVACQYDLFQNGCHIIELPNKTQVRAFVPGVALPFAEEGVKKAYAASYQIQNKSGLGSGVGIRTDPLPDGTYINYIVTNRHVVEEKDGEYAKTLEVTSLWTGQVYKGELINVLTEGKPDMALVAIRSTEPLFSIPIYNSNAIAFGQKIFAVGNPLGLVGSVTAGIISHPRRPAADFDAGEGYVIQFDAPISPGNSGGPLITQDGQLIGINTFTIPGRPNSPAQNINFAFPADTGINLLFQELFPLASSEVCREEMAA